MAVLTLIMSFSNQHNKFIFSSVYNRNIESFLNNEFVRLFEVELTHNLMDSRQGLHIDYPDFTSWDVSARQNSVIRRTCDKMSEKIIKKVKSKSRKLQEKAGEWVKNYIRSNFNLVVV